MSTNRQFAAPWGKQLRLMTTVGIVICIGVAFIGLVSFPEDYPFARWMMLLLPVVLLVSGALFLVRGYTLDKGSLIIQRLIWSSHLDLDSLVSAASDPMAMSGSIRVAGNGGLFAICGWFRNSKLGSYRAFGTDPDRSVVLRFTNQTVVVTPDSPELFVENVLKEK